MKGNGVISFKHQNKFIFLYPLDSNSGSSLYFPLSSCYERKTGNSLSSISAQLHLKVSQHKFQMFVKLLSKTAQHMICGQLIYFKLFSLIWISDQLNQHASKHFLCSSFLYSYFSCSFILLDVCLYQCPGLMSLTQSSSGAIINSVCTAGVCL